MLVADTNGISWSMSSTWKAVSVRRFLLLVTHRCHVTRFSIPHSNPTHIARTKLISHNLAPTRFSIEYPSFVDNKLYSTGEFLSGISASLKSARDSRAIVISKPSTNSMYEIGGRAGCRTGDWSIGVVGYRD